ncbi:preprotein translocase subunit SecE [Patulibacter minatonensis]|uniref:preprotein translocase subunit SecE n=1 Tax=Patulibacter minatonensis TaxID=298163 RepID=UPI0004BA560F|nr:preprotein translocase subunit SecE [Patulibacter minatonensis]
MAVEDHDNERPRLSTSPAGAGAAGGAPSSEKQDVVRTSGGIRRFPGFLKASWAELQRVRWPDRAQVAQGTGVVIVFVALAGAFLGGVDKVASELVDLVI